MSSRLLKAVTSPEIEVVGALLREGTGLCAGQLKEEWTLGLSQRERGTRLPGHGQINPVNSSAGATCASVPGPKNKCNRETSLT